MLYKTVIPLLASVAALCLASGCGTCRTYDQGAQDGQEAVETAGVDLAFDCDLQDPACLAGLATSLLQSYATYDPGGFNGVGCIEYNVGFMTGIGALDVLGGVLEQSE